MAKSLPLAELHVQPYTLKKGDTVSSVARRYDLSVEQLKELNQFRIFSRPFEQLTVGDDIDVPELPSKKESDTSDAQAPDSEAGRWLASGASDIGSAMSGRNHPTLSNVAGSRARSTVVSGAQSAISQWLGQFGTTNVQFGVNDDLSLGESSLDMLIPLHDTPGSAWFIQTGGRYMDRRTTLNVGTGIRFFPGKWMVGANTFFDNDITGHNHRLGLGGELWTDYLHFSGNTYARLNGWHQSRDFEDYDERPANGFDLSVNGWLPEYPQLGGKIKYEQYYGDEVALVSKDSRQKNPGAVTVGVEYTPVPLITVGADYRKSGGNDDATLNIQFRWTPGMTLAQQLSPDAVAAGRMLAGSRLDLVERNNNIILDYKKQELIRLSLPDAVHGPENSSQILGVSVTSKYGLDHIEWRLPADFVNAGGGISEPSRGSWEMRLPLWQATGANQYELTGVAWDVKGNASRPVRMRVSVEQRRIDASHTTLQLDSALNFPADGTTRRKIILTARDAGNFPVRGLVPLISIRKRFTPGAAPGAAPPGAGKSIVMMLDMIGRAVSELLAPSAYARAPSVDDSSGAIISDFTESAPGVYEASLTSGEVPGELLLTLSVDDTELTPLKVYFGEVAWLLTNPRVMTPQPLADGLTAAEVRVSVAGKDSGPAQRKVLTVYVDNLPQKITSDDQGDITVKLPPQSTPGEHSFDIHSGNSHLTVSVTYLSAAAIYSKSALTADRQNLLADGHDKATINLMLGDDTGRPVSGLAVTFSATPATGVIFSPVTDHGDGNYSAEVRGAQAGQFIISALVGMQSVPVKPLEFNFENRVLQIYRNGAPLQGNPVVGDRLNVVVQCDGVSPGQTCINAGTYHWEMEVSPGSDTWTGIVGATGETYIVSREVQKHRLRVSEY